MYCLFSSSHLSLLFLLLLFYSLFILYTIFVFPFIICFYSFFISSPLKFNWVIVLLLFITSLIFIIPSSSMLFPNYLLYFIFTPILFSLLVSPPRSSDINVLLTFITPLRLSIPSSPIPLSVLFLLYFFILWILFLLYFFFTS